MNVEKSKAFAGPQHIIFGMGILAMFVITAYYNKGILEINKLIKPLVMYVMIPGLALFPDVDIPNSTISYQLGWLDIVCKPLRIFGHRTLTHSLLFLGPIVVGIYLVPYNAVTIIIFAISIGYLLAKQKIKGLLNFALSFVLAYAASIVMGRGFAALIFIIGAGSHLIGDMFTAPLPILWPLPFKAGGKVLQGHTSKIALILIFVVLGATLIHFGIRIPQSWIGALNR